MNNHFRLFGLFVIAVILVFASLAGCVSESDDIDNLKEEIVLLEEKNENYRFRIYDLEDENYELSEKLADTEYYFDELKYRHDEYVSCSNRINKRFCLLENSTRLYHFVINDCESLYSVDYDDLSVASIGDAKRKGYKPCPDCRHPYTYEEALAHGLF